MRRLTPAVYAEAVKRLEWGDGRQAVHHGSIPPTPARTLAWSKPACMDVGGRVSRGGD